MKAWSKFSVAVLVIGLGLLTAGCLATKTTWHKPGVTEDQWAIDDAGCRSHARNQAERDYAADDRIGERGGVQETAAFNSSMRSYDAERNERSLYHRCLERKGYRRVDPDKLPAKQVSS